MHIIKSYQHSPNAFQLYKTTNGFLNCYDSAVIILVFLSFH